MKLNQPMSAEEALFWRLAGNHISKARRAHGRGMTYDKRRVQFSQKKLGDAVGLSRCTIANIERGKQRVTHYMYLKIMEFLK